MSDTGHAGAPQAGGIEARAEKMAAYARALQRAIWRHCQDEEVPDDLAAECPFHAEKLNDHLAAMRQQREQIELLQKTIADWARISSKLSAMYTQQRERIEALEANEKEWRKMLWFNHGCRFSALYGDDGEMSCGRCGIDFKRMAPKEIQAIWRRRNLATIEAAGGIDKLLTPTEATDDE